MSRYGAKLILNDEITFRQLMTAIMSLMLGTFGLGSAMSDMGDQKVQKIHIDCG